MQVLNKPSFEEIAMNAEIGAYQEDTNEPPLSPPDFLDWLRQEGPKRYHDLHPFHLRMHAGELTRQELETWVVNRYYYQTRIPIKDALLLSKSEDPAFRRVWIRRISDHDGREGDAGGLERWLQLGEALGVSRARMSSLREVLPGVRRACDSYVELVRQRSLLEGVAASLTEMFAPDLMSRRIEAFERHYGFQAQNGLAYFETRVVQARRDAEDAIAFVTEHATTRALQAACMDALVKKTDLLWEILDHIDGATPRAHVALA